MYAGSVNMSDNQTLGLVAIYARANDSSTVFSGTLLRKGSAFERRREKASTGNDDTKALVVVRGCQRHCFAERKLMITMAYSLKPRSLYGYAQSQLNFI